MGRSCGKLLLVMKISRLGRNVYSFLIDFSSPLLLLLLLLIFIPFYYCKFQMARTDGQDVDVPLLQIFWDNSSPTPSTVISLDSAVVLPEDNLDTTKSSSNHPFRFKIRHLKKSVNPEHSLQMTRIFSCSEKAERDEWVYLINAALLNYEKEKASSKRLNHLSLSPPRVRGTSRSWAKEDVMPAQLSTARQQNTSTSIRLSTPLLFPS